MNNLNISLVNLDKLSSSNLGKELRGILDKENIVIQEAKPDGMNASGDSLLMTANGQQADILLLVLPKSVADFDRMWIRTLCKHHGKIPVLAVVEDIETSATTELLSLGVTDFITAPLKECDIMPHIRRLTEHLLRKCSLAERLKEVAGLRQIIGESPVFTAELQKIPCIAGCDSSVLISGETGTGKEMFARAIHYLGPRAGKPFIPVNCGAIPSDLIENELFGHIKGAFTGAISSQDGLIGEAEGGTLLLDEIDCLPGAAQVKLLRLLQTKEYRRLGSAKTLQADIRVIAATNADLEQAVHTGVFRRDLYYRLNIIPLTLPALRNRRNDILPIAKHFLEQSSRELGKRIESIEPAAEHKLLSYDWPGNVRELQNVIERAVVFSGDSTLQSSDLDVPLPSKDVFAESFQQAKTRVVNEFEKNYINNLLIVHQGNITHAAKSAGKNRRAFWELIRKHHIDTGRFRSPAS